LPSPDAALGDGVFAARRPPPWFVNGIIPEDLGYLCFLIIYINMASMPAGKTRRLKVLP
jgi:hypothetical protein